MFRFFSRKPKTPLYEVVVVHSTSPELEVFLQKLETLIGTPSK